MVGHGSLRTFQNIRESFREILSVCAILWDPLTGLECAPSILPRVHI